MFSRSRGAPSRSHRQLYEDAREDIDLKGDAASDSRFSHDSIKATTAATLAPPSIRTLSTLQATLLALLAAVSWAVACSGACVLAWLLISRMYIPKDIEWHRPLYFDYGASLSTAVALIPLTHDPDAVPAGSISSALPSGPGSQDASGWPHAHSPPFLSSEPPATAPKLLLSPGRRASLSVRLRLPPAKDQDLFQVTGEFLTAEGQLLGRSARTHVPRPRALVPRVVHYALTAPWAAIGLYDDSELVELRLFDAFGVPLLKAPSGASTRKGRRRSASNSGGGPGNGSGDTSGVADAPAQPLAPPAPAYFRARLVGRSPSAGPPKVYSADMHLKLKLGWIEGFFFHLSPGPLLALVLLASGVAMALGGSSFAGALLIASIAILRWGWRAAERMSHQAQERQRTAARRGAAAGAARTGYDAGSEEEHEEGGEGEEVYEEGQDSFSGQWFVARGKNGEGEGLRVGAGEPDKHGRGGRGEEAVRSGRGEGGEDEGEEFLEPASPLEEGQDHTRWGRGAWEEGEGSAADSKAGAAVSAIKGLVGRQQRVGGFVEDDSAGDVGDESYVDADESAGHRQGGAGDEGWRHIIAGGAEDDGGAGGGSQRSGSLGQRRGWRFRG